jgi:uncharacterized membrane protein YfcA
VNWSEQLVLLLVSLTANGFSAFAGGGAGLLQLPALIFLGLPFGVALATHKVATVALGFGATLRHWRSRRLERGFTLYILGCGLPGVVLGAHLALELPDRVAQVALGALTLALGLYSILKKELGQNYLPCRRDLRGYALGAVALFTIGVLNGALASGTGLFVTLWLVRWFGLDYQRAVAYTLVLVGLFWNGAGALTLSTLGRVQWDWLPALILGAVIGGYLGAHFALKQGNRWIKRAFEIVTLLVGLKLLLG